MAKFELYQIIRILLQESMATFPNAIFSVFRQCLSSTRRRQFDRDQRLSLLNTEGELEKLRPIDRDSAALELRRRLQLQEFYDDDDDDYNFDRQLVSDAYVSFITGRNN